jgi:NAD(P)-dependent dehydrogenase (short-subunit alcohol dehydrogenase family)
MDPKGKVAMLTGSARIGLAVAHALAARGCGLSVLYRSSRDAAEGAAGEASAQGLPALALRADVTDHTQVEHAVKQTMESFGRVDILINMASIYLETPTPSLADWSLAMQANATSAFHLSMLTAPIMKLNGGRIINFADWLPVSGRPRYKGYVPYYSSKATVVALTESLALELAPEILVNAIAPGPILAPPDFSAEENARVTNVTPLRRWGGSEEIAKTVLFLIETEFITGECIRVDGGRHLY